LECPELTKRKKKKKKKINQSINPNHSSNSNSDPQPTHQRVLASSYSYAAGATACTSARSRSPLAKSRSNPAASSIAYGARRVTALAHASSSWRAPRSPPSSYLRIRLHTSPRTIFSLPEATSSAPMLTVLRPSAAKSASAAERLPMWCSGSALGIG
jgi:hypothetical protein